MKIIEWLKQNEKLVYFNRCRIYRNKSDFRHMVLEGYHSPDFLEIRSCGDEYRGQIVYHIGAFGRSVGFFAEFLFTLIRLYFAEDRGFSPYVYWGDEFLYYEADGFEKEKNAFLYYFAPVSDVRCSDNAAHVLIANDYHIKSVQDRLNTHGYVVSDEYMNELSSMIKKYIRYNEKTKNYLENEYEKLIGNKKALAVHFRGTDYRRQYNNHPVFVTLEEEILKVREILKEKDYELIFLATDEQAAVDIFQQEFGERVKAFEDVYRAVDGNESVAYRCISREKHHYLLGLEVLRDQYMLTRCDGLVCGVSNLTISARLMRKAWYDRDYNDLVILNHGVCDNNNKFSDAKH